MIKRLYEKDELLFALTWIGVYVVALSLADGVSESLGLAKLITALVSILLSVFLLWWLGHRGLLGKYGLAEVKLDPKPYLYFLPLAVIASTNLWGGVAMHFSPVETVLYVVSMIGVGILEEIIFRGFLFKALCRENAKSAILISSITFGVGHIVNLLNGAELLPTLLQVCYAAAVGFLFTVLFYRSGTLLPCILTHSVVNSLSAFGGEISPGLELAAAGGMSAVALAYAAWILKNPEKKHS